MKPSGWKPSTAIGANAVLVPVYCEGELTRAAFTTRGRVWCMRCHERLRFLEPKAKS